MMKNQILITIAGAALNGPVEHQLWQCDNCSQVMDVTAGLAHILYDCPCPATPVILPGAGPGEDAETTAILSQSDIHTEASYDGPDND